MQSTNGYEARRQICWLKAMSGRLKAGAAASAIALVPTKLASGSPPMERCSSRTVESHSAGNTVGAYWRGAV